LVSVPSLGSSFAGKLAPDGISPADPGQWTQTVLLVWLFGMRIVMIFASVGSYMINEAITKAKYATADKMNFEHPLTVLVWLTSIVSVVLTFVTSYLLIGKGDS